MDLPTYTNIWRIEKRLYKLYDLRLPMPLPIVWIGVFVGVSAFWWVLLQVVGLPFDAPWHVIYLVPPGIVTWLSTRPVIEGKRLTELLQSQTRYFSEPKTWCRLAPSGEPDVIDFQARVWRASTERVRVKKPKRAAEPQRATVRPAVAAAAAAAAPVVEEIPVRVKPPLTTTSTAQASPEPARRLIGHPDDKQTALPEGRRPATFGQPPRLIRPVTEPADPAKDRSRPLAANPLRPALLAHPSDKPASTTPERGDRPQSPTVPMRLVPGGPARPEDAGLPTEHGPRSRPSDAPTAAEGPSRPEPPSAPTRPAASGPQLSDVPTAAEGPSRPEPPVAPTRPAASGPHVPHAARAEAEARSPELSDVPVWPVPDGHADTEMPGVAERPATGSQAADVPTRPVPAPDVPVRSARGAEAPTRPVPAPDVPVRSARGADTPIRPVPARWSQAPEERMPAAAGTGSQRADGPETDARPAEAETASPQFSWSPVAKAEPDGEAAPVEPVEAARPGASDSGVTQFVQEETPVESARVPRHSAGEVVREEPASSRVGRHAAAKPEAAEPEAAEPEVAVPPARVEPQPVAEAPEVVPVVEPRRGEPVVEPRQAEPVGEAGTEEVSSPPIRPDALRRLRRLAASADSAVEPEAPAPAVDWQKERLRKGQPPAPFIPAERGSEATWRRVSQVVAGSDGDNDEDRARTTINGSRRIVVLGCTGGAGQTTTTLLLGHSLARLREDGVVAVDANSGGDGLTGRVSPETPETLSSFLTAVDSVGTRVRDYTTRTDSGLDVLAADVDPGAEQRIGDRGWFSDQRIARAMRLLDQQYRIILMDPAAALAARLLPYADQLVLVAPASADAPDSVAMTYDWLDGHGCADLRRRAVVVINGVSRRSMADVERAETVARGRCRAIVRVPWEDELAEPGQVDLNDLRSGGRRAYVALAGVVASGLTTARGESFVG
ncbi:TcpE family conjugal transfer membrane protein [Herbidospora cretacea]|uniref:TcpE family conjugal transfer membrane protein n=1 Tax=Herbidospora cretacea TaxID=28444 RepID=UPI0004C3B083|nr:TcpE family conjugal transfer membrane protein [Herbidospora cretacea]